MRRLLLMTVATLFAFSANAAEPPGADLSMVSEATPLALDAGVVISPVPMPSPVIETLMTPVSKLRPTKKLKLAKKKTLPVLVLSRTERRQIALALATTDNGDRLVGKQVHDQNDDVGFDELVLHRSYSRPKLAEVPDDADQPDRDELSPAIKLRLLMARLKAVEAHALAQIDDDGEALPPNVAARLAAARQQAVALHQRKFS